MDTALLERAAALPPSLARRDLPKVVMPHPKAATPKWRPDLRKLRPCWRDAGPLLPTLLDPACFWMMYGSFEDEPLVLSPWEVAHLHDYSLLRARVKAPQIGFSMTCALEALHEALLFEDSFTLFVSVDQREAAEKVLYARKLYDGLPPPLQDAVPLAKDSYDQLWFGRAVRPARIESIPATSAMRGRRGNVVLDEADYHRDGGIAAFRSAIGRISLGGRVSVGSTVFGEGTLLARITADPLTLDEDELEDIRTKFSIAELPWSVVTRQSQLEVIGIAAATLDEYEFAEEYECLRGGKGTASFDPDLLRMRTHTDAIAALVDERLVFDDEEMWVGYDVGVTRNPSVLSAFGLRGGVWQQSAIHLPKTEDGRIPPLTEQEAVLIHLLQTNPRMRLVIDGKGIGMQAAQKLERKFAPRVVNFQANSKPAGKPSMDRYDVCVELRRLLEAGTMELMADRTQYDQFRKTRLAAGKVEQKGHQRDSHFDVFWAAAMASYGIAMGRRRIHVPASPGVVPVAAGSR